MRETAIIPITPNSLDRLTPGFGPLSANAPSEAPPATRRAGLPQVIWRHKLLVAAPVLGALLLAMIYKHYATRLYTSSGRFTIQAAGSRLAGDSGDVAQYANFLYTQREKLMSRDILAGALAMPANAPGAATIKDLKTFANSEAPLEDLRDNLEVNVGRKDDTLEVRFETPYPDEAKVVVNAVIENFIQWQTRPHRRSNSTDVLEAYSSEKKKVEAELAEQTRQMTTLEQQYGVLGNKDQDNVVFRQLGSISQALESQRAQTLKDKQDYESASRAVRPEARLAMPGTQVLVSADDEQVIRGQILQYQQRLEEMQQRYLPNHPAILAVRQRLESLAASYADALQRRYYRSLAIQEDLQRQFDQENKKAVEVSAKIAQYGRLQSDADRQRRLIDTLETRIHDVNLQNAAGAVNIEFFEPASIVRQSYPAPLRTLALAMMLGLGMGVTLAFTRDWMDDRLRSADEIRAALGAPVLGVIPQMPGGAVQALSAQKVALDPGSEVAEAFRSLRTAVYFGAPKDRSKTILVTSPSPADGKTTSAANLACVMAQAGKRVLLIDADLRSPRQHAVFGVRDAYMGLALLLREEIQLEEAIQPTQVPNLALMPAGAKPSNPSELLNSPIFSELLETLADKYDQVIIDSPPVMGLADSRIIAACCDLTLLVLRAGHSTRKASRLARDGLAAVGAQILGVVVNDVSRRSEGDFETAAAYGYGDRPPARAAARAAIPARPAPDKLEPARS